MSVPSRLAQDRLPLMLRPQALAASPAGTVVAVACALALGVIFAVDVAGRPGADVGALTLVVVAGAGWELSVSMTTLVVIIAALLLLGAAIVGGAHPVAAAAQIAATPVMAVLARLAATTLVRSRQTAEYAERMRELESAKTRFLNLASHEMRRPLAVVAGYLELIDGGSLGEMPAGTREVMPTLRAKIAEMSRLIERMLETARLEDGRLELRLVELDMGELVARAVEEVRPRLTGRHQVALDLPGRPMTVRGDRERVSVMVTTLLDNAIKYSPQGGVVGVSLAELDGVARVSVRDHGLGIAAGDMASLFTRFGRIVTRETSQIGGTGLGLYLARELARLHGGDITATSRQGLGSTFLLALPASPPAEEPVAERRLRPAASGAPGAA